MTETVGIILAGGSGSRMWPASLATSKQLLPLAGRPMIYYPLATLMLAGVTEFEIIASPQSINQVSALIGDGAKFGVSVHYQLQEQPLGIAHGFALSSSFAANKNALAILGDNFFFGPGLGSSLKELCGSRSSTTLFLKHVPDVSPFGVAEIDGAGQVVSLVEKPVDPKSSLAVTGLYFLKPGDLDHVKSLKPSARGEIEILELFLQIMKDEPVSSEVLSRATFWSDLGTFEALTSVDQYISSIEKTQSSHVLVPELIAVEEGLVSRNDMLLTASTYPASSYRRMLEANLQIVGP